MNNELKHVIDSFLKADGHILQNEQLDGLTFLSMDEMGFNYRFQQINGYGFRLVKEPLLTVEQQFIETVQTKRIGKRAYFFDKVTSTQKIAKQFASNNGEEGTLIVAEQQTEGRGRLTRKWHSEKGGLWFSLIVKPRIPISIAPQLTLLTAVAVVQTIEDLLPIQSKIKWPNDILINGKKVCGILTELETSDGQIDAVIIGVGLNVNQTNFPKDIQRKATSLALETEREVDRLSFLQRFCFRFEKLYELFLQNGFQSIKPLWEQNCETIGKEVTVTTLNGTNTGKAIGISDEGALLLKEIDGNVSRILSADIDET